MSDNTETKNLLALRSRLAQLRMAFEAAGGRGIEIADEIDVLELAIDGLVASQGNHATCSISTVNNGAVSTVTVIVDGETAEEFRRSLNKVVVLDLLEDIADFLKNGDGTMATHYASEVAARLALFHNKG